CRSTEYESAVRSGRRMPATALVVELLPVPELDATAYLSAGRLAGDQRWAPVFAQLRNQPQRPVAQALSTPLMVGLTRLVYAGPDTDASTLLSLTGRADVERCLLDGFLATAYPSDKLPRVLRWLRFVARHLDRQGSHDLAWWELHRALPKHQAARLTGVVLSAATAVISGIAVWLLMAPSGAAGRITAIAVGAAAAVTAALVGPAVAIGAASAVPQRINTQL